MDRKWRTNRSALDTVLSFPQFTQLAQPWRHGYTLATLTDLYAVYTVLHIESKEWSLQWSEEGQFYYFLVKQTIVDGTVAAPEGDEDPPELTAEATADEAPAPKKRKLAAKDSDIDPTGTPKADEESEMEDHVDAATEEGLENAVESTGAVPPAEPKIRTQLIVPVTSASCEVTPLLLQRVFAVRGVSVQQILLGLVDSNGVVTRCCLYNYIQPPLEGPGTANLELLDD